LFHLSTITVVQLSYYCSSVTCSILLSIRLDSDLETNDVRMDVFAASRMDPLAVESRSWRIDLGGDFCMGVQAVHRGEARAWKDLI
jgi:hypothetical protein